jgi:acetaldehyde dehydrogenase (acetylating)
MTTGLDPAMTLGCGGWGGNITSDNISPKHLLNVKRLAYETQPAKGSAAHASAIDAPLPGVSRPQRAGLDPASIGPRIDRFLASRGIPSPESGPAGSSSGSGSSSGPGSSPGSGSARPAEFVCEEDVRQAVKAGLTIVLDSRTIVTPAARDLGEEKRVFVDAR